MIYISGVPVKETLTKPKVRRIGTKRRGVWQYALMIIVDDEIRRIAARPYAYKECS